MTKVSIFIVDDSASSRLLLRRVLASDPQIEVVGESTNGKQALVDIPIVDPDLVLMDVMMPVLGGLQATEQLMRLAPMPVLMVSDLADRDAHLNFKALQAGAIDIVRKPTLEEVADETARARFARRVRLLAEVPIVTRHPRRRERPATTGLPPIARETNGKIDLVCIGASTGGPPALLEVLTALGPDVPWPMLVVQHMTIGFIGGMARWLSDACKMPVRLATTGERLQTGSVYLAPDGKHLNIHGSRIVLTDEAGDSPHCPSVDALFESTARSGFAASTIAVLLTGMGEDGARGLRQLRSTGAWTIAQDEATSIVYGMPKAAHDNGGACEMLPLHKIGKRLLSLGGSERASPNKQEVLSQRRQA